MWFIWHLHFYYFFNEFIQIILWISNAEHLNVLYENAQEKQGYVFALPLMIRIGTDICEFFKFDIFCLFCLYLCLFLFIFFAFFAVLFFWIECFWGNYCSVEEVLDYLQDWGNCQVSKALNQTGKQINTLILNISHFENWLRPVMQEYIIVFHVLCFIALLNYHVAADCHQEGNHSLTNYFLYIWPLYQRC